MSNKKELKALLEERNRRIKSVSYLMRRIEEESDLNKSDSLKKKKVNEIEKIKKIDNKIQNIRIK